MAYILFKQQIRDKQKSILSKTIVEQGFISWILIERIYYS